MFSVAACSAPPPQITRATPVSTTPPDHAPLGLPLGKILFSKGGVDLWSAAPDGSTRVPVTTDGTAGGGYLWAKGSPDGTLIAAGRAGSGVGGSSLFLVPSHAA